MADKTSFKTMLDNMVEHSIGCSLPSNATDNEVKAIKKMLRVHWKQSLPRVFLEVMSVSKECQTLEEFNIRMAAMIGESIAFSLSSSSYSSTEDKETINALESLRKKKEAQNVNKGRL